MHCFFSSFQKILANLKKEDYNDIMWLKIVWSLSILNKAESRHFESVLDPMFVEQFISKFKINKSKKHKITFRIIISDSPDFGGEAKE